MPLLENATDCGRARRARLRLISFCSHHDAPLDGLVYCNERKPAGEQYAPFSMPKQQRYERSLFLCLLVAIGATIDFSAPYACIATCAAIHGISINLCDHAPGYRVFFEVLSPLYRKF
jgi:hypothetical protein